MVGMELDSVEVLTERSMRGMLKAMAMDNPSPPLYTKLQKL